MNFEDLHNDLNSFPEELNFSDARWEEALSVIKAHEAKRRRVAWGGAFSALASAYCHLFFGGATE